MWSWQCDVHPPPCMTSIPLLVWHASSSWNDVHPPPHMTCIFLFICHASSSSYDMHPPPQMKFVVCERCLQSHRRYSTPLKSRTEEPLPFRAAFTQVSCVYTLNMRRIHQGQTKHGQYREEEEEVVFVFNDKSTTTNTHTSNNLYHQVNNTVYY